MVEDTRLKKLQSYSDAVDKINENKYEKNSLKSRTVEIFFSFDIVNSSLYKDTNYLGWQTVLSTLLTDIQKSVTKEIPAAQLWRVLGDEIIFFVTIRNVKEIYSTVDAIFGVLVATNTKLKNENFFDNFNEEFSDKEISWMKKSNILAVQSAAWLAIISYGDNSLFLPYDNIFKKYRINDSQQINEFLGQDIDTGFRIKKETQDRRLVVSVELAKILSDKTEYLSRLNIITYKSLKGVWQNRLYPIIWYHDQNVSGVSFEDSFYYDETTYSQLSKEYFLNREKEEGNITSYMFLDVHKALKKIIKDQKLSSKLEEIYQVIDITENDVIAVENEFDNRYLEFHCAAVCCDVDNKKIFIAKRKNRKLYSGLWGFGCAKASIDKNLCDSVKEDYKNDFGFDIDIICDGDRDDAEPKPIALYQINKVDKLQKGVIVVAKITQNTDKIDNAIKAKGKHEEYRWISEEEAEKFAEPAINDFKDTLKKVFSMWDEIFKEK